MTKSNGMTAAMVEAFGPLAELYRDEQVQSIMVDGLDNVYVEKNNELVDTKVAFASLAALRTCIHALFKLVGREPDTIKERADIRLADGSRVTAVFSPVSLSGPVLLVTKAVDDHFDWDELIERGCIDRHGQEIIEGIIAEQASVVIAGSVGSGKTTVASLFVDTLPQRARIVTVEHNAELALRRQRCVRLEETPSLSLSAVLETATKLRPDWLVVNEVKGQEAQGALDTMRDGLPTLAVVTARGVTNALSRLVELSLMASPSIGLAELRTIVADAVRYVIYVERGRDGVRRIADVSAVLDCQGGTFQLEPLYRWDDEAARFVTIKASSSSPSS